MPTLDFTNKQIVCFSQVPYKNPPAETFCISETYRTITVGVVKLIPKADYECNTLKGQYFCYKSDSGCHRFYVCDTH